MLCRGVSQAPHGQAILGCEVHGSDGHACADVVFAGISALGPPFLASRGTYATFNNCLFHSVHVSDAELLDVSHYGTVALVDTLFANTTFPRGVAATRAAQDVADSGAPGSDPREGPDRVAGFNAGATGVTFSPASPDDVTSFGAEFVAMDETVRDCCGDGRCHATLPECPGAASGVASAPMHPTRYSTTASPVPSAAPALSVADAPGWPTVVGTAQAGLESPAAAVLMDEFCARQAHAQAAGGQIEVDDSAQATGRELGFCAGATWHSVDPGEKLAVTDPWLMALVGVRAARALLSMHGHHAWLRFGAGHDALLVHAAEASQW